MLYLASKSPRRRALLKQLGIVFETLHVDINEHWDGCENPADYVMRLAREKAKAGRQQAGPGSRVLAADTEVVVDGIVQGKPATAEEATAMLMRLSGRCHEVLCGVALVDEREQVALSINQVCFSIISTEQCRAYCDSGEPYDKAGGYGIQGRAANFVRRLQGSYSAVMGLPVVETCELLGIDAGYPSRI